MFWVLAFGIVIFAFGLSIWLRSNRRYASSSSVASAYDSWTNDQLLEVLWGEHIHLGYYRNNSRNRDFRESKEELVHQLVRWSGLSRLPRGSRILDVGCGIGGSSRILAKAYGFEVIGITISSAQVERAICLTEQGLPCTFKVMDALKLEFEEGAFDGVWSVEAGPHMPDKQRYADEMLRVLRPGGILAVADWNRRDPGDRPMNQLESLIMQQLLNQWVHPEFASIDSFRRNLLTSKYFGGSIETDDWTESTLPSWIESIFEGVRRPRDVLALGPKAILMGLREIPTILLMHWAFTTRLMQFGVFRARG